ncbi:hypothetical protein PGT21_035026 [Puccinia graminis f. sp. tritici]|uniref:CCHC-type domain-containing protein n=1 Tax=Puccinia graminis f. sp. tritici TaxID=56615 RepID=A0A5B0N7J7_PUCGR|nr:hypothetical protein PGTUg99_022601 [Puccinia graminis f. sp. tritici]KAA1084742.1 hypothetical protein PGT21_035026 [Puccinia graminis f. sp. tritici]
MKCIILLALAVLLHSCMLLEIPEHIIEVPIEGELEVEPWCSKCKGAVGHKTADCPTGELSNL